MNKLLIFDLDGTLVDCKALHQRAFRTATGDLVYADSEVEGLPTVKKIEYLTSLGLRVPADAWEQKQRLTYELLDTFVKYNDPLWEQMWRLKHHYDLAVCSNATRKFTETVLNILEIKSFMNAGIYTASESIPKPAPDMYLQCIGDRDPATVTIFEDSPVGIEAATRTGAWVEVVKNSRHLCELLCKK